MFISRIELKNYKRFTDCVIDLSALPQPPKLVLLIGANGSGKSSIFDALEALSVLSKRKRRIISEPYLTDYYRKNHSQPYKLNISFNDGKKALRTDEKPNRNSLNMPTNSFYGRSSLRQLPQLTRTSLGQPNFDWENDVDCPSIFIERDNRFENDIEILTQEILEEVFTGEDFDNKKLKDKYLHPINDSLLRIFGGVESPMLELIALKPPLRGQIADVRFKKGASEFHYNLLSSGEKEVINILLNLFVRRDKYQDTIYFIDELDIHLNTKLQKALLKEITENWIPENCQLWTASHSLGFIEYARETGHAAIIDFNDYDFDEPHTLTPDPKSSLDIFDIAVPKETIFNLFDNKEVILCENQNDQFYNLLNLENKLFVGVTDKNRVFINVKRDNRYQGLMDRDFLTDTEINKARKKYPKLHVLQYYCFENYLYHPKNISEIIPGFNPDDYIQEIYYQKEEQKLKIVAEIKTVRNSYAILKDEENIAEKNIDTIIDAFSSNKFEVYYQFFDMKGKFNKNILAKYNLKKEQLVKTNWFKSKMTELLNNYPN